MIDLHTHSTASDGSLSPIEIAEAAAEIGLNAVALTDHDTVAGLDSFIAHAKVLDLPAIPGVEVSCSWFGGSLHIVGLFIDWLSPALEKMLEKLRADRAIRNQKILQRLLDHGITIPVELLEEIAGDGLTGRPHIAEALVRQDAVKDKFEAFDSYLGRGRRAYVARQLPQTSEVIESIHQAGGITVWAHPFAMGRRPTNKVRKIAQHLKEHGLDGIETYYSEYTDQQQRAAIQIADDLELCKSGGSDFHGRFSPGVALGSGRGNLQVPDDLLIPLQQKRDAVRDG